MSTALAIELVEQLEDNLDDLEETLQPLTSQAISESTKKLPLLDRAKLYITTVYAIESLLFSYLKINGVDAKEHPVFLELTRVKQYFEKIKNAESGTISSDARELSLDKQAALRMIKHSLAANKQIDLERAEAEARQRLIAKRKLKLLEASMQEKASSNDQSATDVHITPAEEQEVADLVASAVGALDVAASVDESASTSAVNAVEHSKRKEKKNKKRKQEAQTDDKNELGQKRPKGEKKKAHKKKLRERQTAASASEGAMDIEIESPG